MSIFIIAEAGVNHNGNIATAKMMVDCAAEAGVDCIKFQTFRSEKVVSKYADKAEYQVRNTLKNESHLEMLKQLELSNDDFIKLYEYCVEKRIEFLSTPFDIESIKFLNTMNIRLWKIPSGEITNLPYLECIGSTGKPVIMSTGMSSICEIDDAIGILKKAGCNDITLLHCNTEYPTPFRDANLNAITTLRNRFKVPVGYSDHTLGTEAVIASAALGATVIEKHFTLDKAMPGPDHVASLDPNQLKEMVLGIRNIEQALGDGDKKPTNSEMKNITVARKSIVAGKIIKKGEKFTEYNLTTKRPGDGISPMKWYSVIGTIAKRDYQEDELIDI